MCFEFKTTSYEYKFTSYEFKFTSYEFDFTSYEFKSLSYEFKLTSYEFKSTVQESFNQWKLKETAWKFPYFLRSSVWNRTYTWSVTPLSPCTHLYVYWMALPYPHQLHKYLINGPFLKQKTYEDIRISYSLKYKYWKKWIFLWTT